MFNGVFKIVYFIQLLIAVVVRKYFEKKYLRQEVETQDKSKLEITLLLINGVGMTIPIVYVLSSWLDFANYTLPEWLGWLGVVFFFFAIWMLWRSHYDLGRNWTPVVAIRPEHKLITEGVFKYIRHPMYTAHLIWAVAQILILHNWIAGYSFIVVQIPFYFFRIWREEKMMRDQFGEEYIEYMNQTKRLIPGVL
ncbi:MAG: protein-S-isoprenylcysteine O-methyltransferase [Bacteroidota bacterium]